MMRKKKYLSLDEQRCHVRRSLEMVSADGVRLYVDGEESSPADVVRSCVNEAMNYMPDYVVDANGLLTEIRYDKVSYR